MDTELTNDTDDTFENPKNSLSDLESEARLIQAILLDKSEYEAVETFLRPEHFFDARYSRIFEALVSLREKNQKVTQESLRQHFLDSQELSVVGDLTEFAAPVDVLDDAVEYARVIHDLYLRRELIAFCEYTTEQVRKLDKNNPVNASLELAEQHLYDLNVVAQAVPLGGEFVAFKDTFIGYLGAVEEGRHGNPDSRSPKKATEPERPVGKTVFGSGIPELDSLLGSFHPGDLIALTGASQPVNSELALNVAFNVANEYRVNKGQAGAIVGYMSSGQSAADLSAWVLARQAKLPLWMVSEGVFSDDEYSKILNCGLGLSYLPLHIDDSLPLTIGAVRTRARILKRASGLGLLVVDELEALTVRLPEGIEKISGWGVPANLKALAQELEMPILVTSSSLEQDGKEGVETNLKALADVVLELPANPEGLKAGIEGVQEIVVIKNSHGAVGSAQFDLGQCSDLFSVIGNVP
jgi:replicative DNA helicase